MQWARAGSPARWARHLPIVLILALAAVHPVLAVADHRDSGDNVGVLAGELFGVTAALTGVVITRRLPRNVIGWLFLVSGLCWLVDAASGIVAAHIVAGASAPHAVLVASAWLNWWLWLPGHGVVIVGVPFLFPDGRPASPRWRIPAAVSGAVVVAATVAQLADGLTRLDGGVDAYGSLRGDPPQIVNLIGFGAMVAALVGVVSLVSRFRGASAEVRQQLKWFAYAAAVCGLIDIASISASIAAPGSALNGLGILASTVALSTLPVAVGVAILRYRLYDIDVVISRTLVYAALALFITAVYVGIVVGVGTLIGGAGRPNIVLSIVATAVVAVAFQPLRERLQRIANRLVYGRRATPYEVLSEFSERVAESYAADDVLPRMARVLGEGTGAERAVVWLRAGDALVPAAKWPQRGDDDAIGAGVGAATAVPLNGHILPALPDSDRAVPVRHQGELLGALTVSKRRGEALSPIEEKLLDDLANQAGLVLKNVGLTADLQARLVELRESRKRLVAAQDQERRRLERNLHDGAQQNLVALKVKLGLAEMVLGKDPEKGRELLGQLKADTDEALETLRDLARGIYPPLLADRGLHAALEAQARKATLPVAVEVHAGAASGLPRYPQEIEAAVYFCVLEALQNVQKYARAGRAVVRLEARDDELRFEVEDDGGGFDASTTPRGSGLTNMADRLDALGGRLVVASRPGEGTRLSGTLSTGDASRSDAPRMAVAS